MTYSGLVVSFCVVSNFGVVVLDDSEIEIPFTHRVIGGMELPTEGSSVVVVFSEPMESEDSEIVGVRMRGAPPILPV